MRDGSLIIKLPGEPKKNRFKFHAAGSQDPVKPDQLGHPASGPDGYSVCLYVNGSRVWRELLSPQEPCGSQQTCWSENGDQRKFRVGGPNPAADQFSQGVKALVLRAKDSGLKTRFDGRGTSLPSPTTAMSTWKDAAGHLDVVLQIIKTTTNDSTKTLCWEARMRPPGKIDNSVYKAKIVNPDPNQ